MNNHGQILLPGLALYLLLLSAVFVTMVWGRRQLNRSRLENAAIAASLSAARAQAKLLNDRASFNLKLNLYLNRKVGKNAGMLISEKKDFENWMTLNNVPMDFQGAAAAVISNSVLSGGLGYAGAAGSQVAKLNGASSNTRLNDLDLKLEREDITVYYVTACPPCVIPKPYQDVFYARKWKQDRRRAQPTHQVSWLVKNGNLRAVASAKVYLDLDPENFEHNGGFPRAEGESVLGSLEVQSFLPQFNARRIQTDPLYAWMAN